MPGRIALAAVVTLWLVPVVARAECVIATAGSVMTSPGIERVFSGGVVDVTRAGELGERATFHVTRVWKGLVPERFDLYVWDLTEGRPRFEKGRRYIAMAAASSDPRVRQDLGLSGSGAPLFVATMCTDPTLQSPTLERDLGPGYEPKRRKVGPNEPVVKPQRDPSTRRDLMGAIDSHFNRYDPLIAFAVMLSPTTSSAAGASQEFGPGSVPLVPPILKSGAFLLVGLTR